MQESWRADGDKLTFITCLSTTQDEHDTSQEVEIKSMIGDVNLFVLANEEESGDVSLVGEIELMIALKQRQRQGHGRIALLAFLYYILAHEEEILQEYFDSPREMTPTNRLRYLRVKIGASNARSISLFESIGFEKTTPSPNFFDEFELRRKNLGLMDLRKMMAERGSDGYVEVQYPQNVAGTSTPLLVSSIEERQPVSISDSSDCATSFGSMSNTSSS